MQHPLTHFLTAITLRPRPHLQTRCADGESSTLATQRHSPWAKRTGAVTSADGTSFRMTLFPWRSVLPPQYSAQPPHHTPTIMVAWQMALGWQGERPCHDCLKLLWVIHDLPFLSSLYSSVWSISHFLKYIVRGNTFISFIFKEQPIDN